MRREKLNVGFMATLATFIVAVLATTTWAATQEMVIFNFNPNGTDGANPTAALIRDADGNLYSTTADGGVNSAGTVFELTPIEGGGWMEKILHSFNYTDGYDPQSTVIFDAAGNLYGTAAGGGLDYGTVFELTRSPNAVGGWTGKLLHTFTGSPSDGFTPLAGLVIDAVGNLYGTTSAGGAYNAGMVFEITP